MRQERHSYIVRTEGKTKLTVIAIEQIEEWLAPGSTICGIDLGTKTIGIAISDQGLAFANPRAVIGRRKFAPDADELLNLFQRENVTVAAIGLPVNMDGSEGPRAQATRAFVRNMEMKTECPFVFWDERLSTVAAERALIEQDVSRKKRAGRIDSAAAAFILQGVLDRLHTLSGSLSPK